ncbi:hypothetical protein NECAME_07444 [Necator americanus]|uniref:Uncharacterized protein n=1 Tax=Necator americanus TaxID=51031 RepID=W2TQD6_NECAM|nr:hypothetical protein NECAME_07444 [Necator americanus]ETN83326.1 hypothetical protein NECAME_07444 [Necator americanus]
MKKKGSKIIKDPFGRRFLVLHSSLKSNMERCRDREDETNKEGKEKTEDRMEGAVVELVHKQERAREDYV